MYGKNDCPSKRTDEALPKFDDARDPETINIRLSSMTEFAEWVSCRGTKVN
jgi:hypothetical protein